LRRLGLPYREDLYDTTRAAVRLGVLEGTRVLSVETVPGHGRPRAPARVGNTFPAHANTLGKVLLAFAPEADVSAVVAAGLPALTPYAVTVPHRFLDELARVRTRGWAGEGEEAVVGIVSVAAPVVGPDRRVVAAVP
jgi:DNA-binding IclR family transcriptional regulator